MTAFCAHQFQEAVFAALKADETLSARLTGFYDEPIADAPCPFLMMGDTSIARNDAKGTDGVMISFEIGIWSAEPGQMEVKELIAEVDRVLSGADLSVPGFTTVALKLENAGSMRQFMTGGSRYRGRLAYRAQIYQSE